MCIYMYVFIYMYAYIYIYTYIYIYAYRENMTRCDRCVLFEPDLCAALKPNTSIQSSDSLGPDIAICTYI